LVLFAVPPEIPASITSLNQDLCIPFQAGMFWVVIWDEGSPSRDIPQSPASLAGLDQAWTQVVMLPLQVGCLGYFAELCAIRAKLRRILSTSVNPITIF